MEHQEGARVCSAWGQVVGAAEAEALTVGQPGLAASAWGPGPWGQQAGWGLLVGAGVPALYSVEDPAVRNSNHSAPPLRAFRVHTL